MLHKVKKKCLAALQNMHIVKDTKRQKILAFGF